LARTALSAIDGCSHASLTNNAISGTSANGIEVGWYGAGDPLEIANDLLDNDTSALSASSADVFLDATTQDTTVTSRTCGTVIDLGVDNVVTCEAERDVAGGPHEDAREARVGRLALVTQ
jgi:hypothetical protein